MRLYRTRAFWLSPAESDICGGRRTRGDFRVSIEASSLEEKKVKVHYDKKVDAAYIRFSLDASERVPLKTLFTLEVLKSAT